jgi:hypothetical protein
MAKKRPNTLNNLSQTTSKKQKQAKPSTQVQSSESDPIVIDMDEDNNSNDETTKQPQNLKRSWVWNHFEEDGGEAICQVIVKPGQICGTRLRRDKSQSTKNLHGHLLTIHNLADANLTKKTKASNHMDLDK